VDIRVHQSVEEFRTLAEPVYRRDPVANTIELTLLESGTPPDGSLFVTIWDRSAVIGAAVHTPRYPLVCNAIPEPAIEAVASELALARPELEGVRGERDTALAFAEAWQALTGLPGRVTVEERLYRLGTLHQPQNVDGAARDAADGDRSRLVEWVGQFFGEASGNVHNEGGDEFVETADRVGNRFMLWEADGAPVSMAMLRVRAAGVSRIGPVFTPADRRGRGYGSAVTATVADFALRAGVDDVVLFADLANPTSNGIYQRIGFEPVADSVRIDFAAVA
jgi:predicted GNAT family acetyltransferase